MKQEEKICGNCIFLKGTFCKYFGEYREPYYKHKEHDCFEPHKKGSTSHDIAPNGKKPLELFKQLPHLNGEYEIVDDWGYTPSLYHFDTQWVVSWVHCEEGDTLLDYTANTPEEAIILAYNNYQKDINYHKQNHHKAMEDKI